MKLKRFIGWTCLVFIAFFAILSPALFPNNRTVAYDEGGDSYNTCMKRAVHYEETWLDVDEAAQISSLKSACSVCYGEDGYQYGAMWINSFQGTNTSSGELDPRVYDSVVDTVTDEDANIAVGYLHGQAYGCGTSIGSDAMTARHIYFEEEAINTRHEPHDPSIVTRKQVDYVENASWIASQTLDRSQGRVSEKYWTKPNGSLQVKINISKFINGAEQIGEPDIDNGYSYTTYKKTVHIYRCPNNREIGERQCWSDPSDIYLRVQRKIEPSTCSEKYGNDIDYDHTSSVPTWINGTGNIYYNKCSGTSVLGSRILTKDTSASNYTERAVLKNTDSTRSATIYVKPGTNVKFEQFYLPAAQPVTKTIVTENLTAKRSNGEAISIPSTASNVVELSGSGTISGTWTNYKDIGVVDEDATSMGGAVFTFTQGGYDNTPSFNGSNNTGTAHTGSIITETNSGSRSILAGAVVDELKDEGVSNVKESLETTSLTVVAPYNFENEAIANPTNLHAGVFAGSEASISGTYKTKGKYNDVVRATYATISPKSKLRLYSFISDTENPTQNCNPGGAMPSICKEHTGSENDVVLNPNEITANNVETLRQYTVTVPDADAGKYLCVVAAVYPTSSGADTNYTNTAGNATWGTSTNCTAIQKRAFFQVWGGNLYAKGKVASSTTTKTVVGDTDYTQPITFGSWAEHGIISSKKEVTGVASGAALGYTSNVNGTLINEPGGKANSSKDCRFATFTIANTNCYTGTGVNDSATPGNSNIDLSNNMLDLTNYTNIAKTTTARSSSDSNPLDLASEYTVKDGIRYTYAVGSLYLKSSASLPKGVTQVVYATGSVYISSNLNYQNTTYSNPSDVPQLIIVSGSNIYIKSAVSNADAWLYTKAGTINTCPDGSKSPACNKQLRINGPIVAGKMILNRNYGGGTGNNSGTPAEIINFTPATYIFSQAKSTENTSLRVVYSKEVAPRY